MRVNIVVAADADQAGQDGARSVAKRVADEQLSNSSTNLGSLQSFGSNSVGHTPVCQLGARSKCQMCLDHSGVGLPRAAYLVVVIYEQNRVEVAVGNQHRLYPISPAIQTTADSY